MYNKIYDVVQLKNIKKLNISQIFTFLLLLIY